MRCHDDLKLPRWSVVGGRVFARLLGLVSQEGEYRRLKLRMKMSLWLLNEKKR
jgi:hypothetical protein